MKTLTWCLTLFLTGLLFVQCESTDSPDLMDIPDSTDNPEPPIRTLGFRQTGPSATDFGLWGFEPDPDPDFGEVEDPYTGPGIVPSHVLRMNDPYPNPTNLSTTIQYSTGLDSHTVKIWSIRSLGPYESPSDPENPNPYIKTIYEAQNESAGSFARIWDLTDEAGETVLIGFYRIFLDVNGYGLWRDVAVTEDGTLLD